MISFYYGAKLNLNQAFILRLFRKNRIAHISCGDIRFDLIVDSCGQYAVMLTIKSLVPYAAERKENAEVGEAHKLADSTDTSEK